MRSSPALLSDLLPTFSLQTLGSTGRLLLLHATNGGTRQVQAFAETKRERGGKRHSGGEREKETYNHTHSLHVVRRRKGCVGWRIRSLPESFLERSFLALESGVFWRAVRHSVSSGLRFASFLRILAGIGDASLFVGSYEELAAVDYVDLFCIVVLRFIRLLDHPPNCIHTAPLTPSPSSLPTSTSCFSVSSSSSSLSGPPGKPRHGGGEAPHSTDRPAASLPFALAFPPPLSSLPVEESVYVVFDAAPSGRHRHAASPSCSLKRVLLFSKEISLLSKEITRFTSSSLSDGEER